MSESPRPGYEQARDELVDVVRRLEQGGATLEESLALWERGEALARSCQEWLDGAQARLDVALGARAPGNRALGNGALGDGALGSGPDAAGQGQ